jgi:CheY-like chemotaxis protein
MARILIIDDDAAILSLFEQFLKNEGFDVTTAANGRSGLAQMEKSTPDMIITDIMMPELDGLEIVAPEKPCFTKMQRFHPVDQEGRFPNAVSTRPV